MEKVFCQSCAMPMESEEQFGTNRDGSKNHDYCVYCYEDGEFTNDYTMDEMIDMNLQYLDVFNRDSDVKFTKDDAIAQMNSIFPSLKRWKKD